MFSFAVLNGEEFTRHNWRAVNFGCVTESQWSESEWEALLLEFVSSSLQAADSEDWVVLVASQLSAQLPLLPLTAADERAMLLKCLALAACNLNDRQIINSHLDVMLTPLRNYTPHDSKVDITRFEYVSPYSRFNLHTRLKKKSLVLLL